MASVASESQATTASAKQPASSPARSQPQPGPSSRKMSDSNGGGGGGGNSSSSAGATSSTTSSGGGSGGGKAPGASGRGNNSKLLTHQMSSGSLTGVRSTRDRDITNLVPSGPECSYAACFCEENVWKLADHVRSNAPNELLKCYAVFVSNKKQVVPLWRQRAGRDEEKLVIWDYHVIFVYKPDERCLVFDLDSDLPFPTFFHKYVTETFRTDAILNPEYHRFFRVVPAGRFLQKFASDRRHMRKPDGSWMKPPPPYDCISTQEAVHNLDEFISMDNQDQSSSSEIGEVITLTEFVKKFYRN